MSQLNLRTILSGDNISGVVEKINYNFQQIVLNGGGPQGERGYIGSPGIPGPEGPEGPTGPLGPTGTYVYTGLTAPASVTNLQPPPRANDIYMQTNVATGEIVFWVYDGSTWAAGATISTSEGVFTTASPSTGGDQSVTAAYPRLNKASKLMILDNPAGQVEDQLFVTVGGVKEIASWLSQSLVPWGSIFADTRNHIRLLNTDPDVTGPGNVDRLSNAGGVIFSLERSSLAGVEQILRVKNGDFAPSANNKYFALGLSDVGGVLSLFTDLQNRVAIYGSDDPAEIHNQNLLDSLTVFGSELVYNGSESRLRIDADASVNDGIDRLARFLISRGYTESVIGGGSVQTEYEFVLGNVSDWTDNALRLLGTDGTNSGNLITAEITPLDDRGAYTPKVAIGGGRAIAELEVGTHYTGRLGFGQISATASYSHAAGYQSYNAFRERGAGTSAVWTLRGNGVHNGGAIEWGSSDGKTLSWLLMPTQGTGDRTVTGDSFLTTTSSVTFKRTNGGFAKIFVDSFGYSALGDTQVANAPHLVLGLENQTSPALFNFGNATKGVGLHGNDQSIEWLLGQDTGGTTSSGFRTIATDSTIGGSVSVKLLKTQYRSDTDSSWKNAITVILQTGTASGKYSGNVIVGNADLATTNDKVGKAKLTVIGAAGPTGNVATSGGTYPGAPAIVDFMTPGGTSMFTLDTDGNVIAGLRFGNASYDSSDKYTLDHYEEGTWSPKLETETYISGWDTTKYKILKSNYTRIGNRVQVDFTAAINLNSAITPGSGSLNMFISGLPYRPDFENVYAPGATVTDPLNPIYPVVPLKSSNFNRAGGADSPAGTIIPWPGLTSSIPAGWVLCNGAYYSKTLYPNLWNALKDATGTNGIYGSNSTDFRVPDLRGYFIRGLDNGAGVDPLRQLNQVQQDDYKSHYHIFPGDDQISNAATPGLNTPGLWPGGNEGAARFKYDAISNQNSWFGVYWHTANSGGSETRPKNLAMNYIIATGVASTANSGVGSGEMSGGFVLYNNALTRLYLYTYPNAQRQTLTNVKATDFPVGVTGYVYGNFEYFITGSQTSPVVDNATFNYTVGDTSFNIDLTSLVHTDSPIVPPSTVTLSNGNPLPSWMQWVPSSGGGSLTFAPGYTSIPGPATSLSLLITMYNSSSTTPGTGTITVNTVALAPPGVTAVNNPSWPLGWIVIPGLPPNDFEFLATNSPTSWSIEVDTGTGLIPVDPSWGLTMQGSTFGATVSTNPAYNQGDVDYVLTATNAAGSGSIPFNLSTLAFNAPTWTTQVDWTNSITTPFANFTLDIYDNSTGGTLVASSSPLNMPLTATGFDYGSFTVFVPMTDSQDYFVEATLVIHGSYNNSNFLPAASELDADSSTGPKQMRRLVSTIGGDYTYKSGTTTTVQRVRFTYYKLNIRSGSNVTLLVTDKL